MKIKINIEIDDTEILKIINTIKNTQEEKTKEDSLEVNPSMYARFFDEYCSPWCGKDEVGDKDFNAENLDYVNYVKNLSNELLRNRGYVFLSDLYHAFGIPASKESTEVGWVYDKENPNGDNYVDIMIVKHDKEHGSILLDFNVDGQISNLIKD